MHIDFGSKLNMFCSKSMTDVTNLHVVITQHHPG